MFCFRLMEPIPPLAGAGRVFKVKFRSAALCVHTKHFGFQFLSLLGKRQSCPREPAQEGWPGVTRTWETPWCSPRGQKHPWVLNEPWTQLGSEANENIPLEKMGRGSCHSRADGVPRSWGDRDPLGWAGVPGLTLASLPAPAVPVPRLKPLLWPFQGGSMGRTGHRARQRHRAPERGHWPRNPRP